jgi:hypothetical protein
MNVFALAQDSWTDYCRSLSPTIPHTGPMPLIVPLAICCFFTVFLLVLLVGHFHARKRPMTRVDFEDAYERVIARIPLLKTCSGEELHRLCRSISRDLLEITSFVNNDVIRFVSTYYPPDKRDFRPDAPVTLLIRKNHLLRRGAFQIQALYYIKPLRTTMLRRTNETLAVFSTSWTTLMERYCLDNMALLNQLWKAQNQ